MRLAWDRLWHSNAFSIIYRMDTVVSCMLCHLHKDDIVCVVNIVLQFILNKFCGFVRTATYICQGSHLPRCDRAACLMWSCVMYLICWIKIKLTEKISRQSKFLILVSRKTVICVDLTKWKYRRNNFIVACGWFNYDLLFQSLSLHHTSQPNIEQHKIIASYFLSFSMVIFAHLFSSLRMMVRSWCGPFEFCVLFLNWMSLQHV